MTAALSSHSLSYILVTPVRNGADFIEKTIISVVRQTVLPRKWVIVNDGSTDATGSIVARYLESFPWIEVLQMARHRNYEFAAKARCFNAAVERVSGLEFDIIANLDADISFDESYFEFLLAKFNEIPSLGVAGTPMREGDYDAGADARFNDKDVFGACQVFRRRCLEEIGGYAPIKGGIDWVAVRTARMIGWTTRSFMEKRFIHHGTMGASDCSVWRSFLRYGEKDYFLGNHPLWEIGRIGYQMMQSPIVVRGILIFVGYLWASLRRIERPIPPALIRFNRREQLVDLQRILGKLLDY